MWGLRQSRRRLFRNTGVWRRRTGSFHGALGAGADVHRAAQGGGEGLGGVLVVLRVLREEFFVVIWPEGARATISVKVPPRSIQNCQPVMLSAVRDGVVDV